jgi:hypothetical protein
MERTQRRHNKRHDRQKSEGGKDADHQGKQQLHRKFSGVDFGPSSALHAGVGCHSFEGWPQCHTIERRCTQSRYKRSDRFSQFVEGVESDAEALT